MTKFAVCYLLVFGQLALGGTFALSIPPFFKIQRGFYKSSATVFLSVALLAAGGLVLLGFRPQGAAAGLTRMRLWLVAGLWIVYSIVLGIYLFSLWSENGRIRARAYVLSLAAGLVAVLANVMLLRPTAFGVFAAVGYGLTTVASSMVLGLTVGGMLFGHWYLIDPKLPVDYLRTFVRWLGVALIAEVLAFGLAMGLLAIDGGAGAAAVESLLYAHPGLLIIRLGAGPGASLVLVWMCWQTLKFPQTMAATGLLYIAVMAVLVGELLGRFILFRTAVPL